MRVVLISEVVEDETEVLRRLSEIGIHPASSVTIVETDPASAVVFAIKGQIRSVPRDLAAKIWVATPDERAVEAPGGSTGGIDTQGAADAPFDIEQGEDPSAHLSPHADEGTDHAA